MALGFRIGPKQPKAHVRPRSAGAPSLLSVEKPTAAGVVARGRGADRGEVGARTGFRPRLCPDERTVNHARKILILLLFGPVLEEDWRKERDAVLRNAGGGACEVVFLLEQHPLDYSCPPSPILLGPTHNGPAPGVQGCFPFAVGGETFFGVHRGEAGCWHV